MLESKANQFTLSPEGQILWQEKLNNPVPGQPIAQLEKGEHALKPVIKVIKNDLTAKQDATQLKNHLAIWLKTHLSEVLEPLVLLEIPQGVAVKDDAVSKIAARIYNGLGIVPREELEELIAQLTPETRTDLRAKKIRLGPVLAFIPALNKPAAVKLRALLWSLFEGHTLPAKTPSDGIVSARIEDENPNVEYYRAIGYPLYGGRAVRIDMLDRVISCVYDHAEGGKFMARHEMAEWLGCSIDDLYKVLTDMGHTKIYDPAEEAEKNPVAENADVKVEGKVETPAPQEKTEAPDGAPEAKTEEKAEDKKPQQDIKPELATFRLKKGKAFEKRGGGQAGRAKPFEKKSNKPSNASQKKSFKNKKDKGAKKKDRGPRVISVEAKKDEADSPFAILQQLKK